MLHVTVTFASGRVVVVPIDPTRDARGETLWEWVGGDPVTADLLGADRAVAVTVA